MLTRQGHKNHWKKVKYSHPWLATMHSFYETSCRYWKILLPHYELFFIHAPKKTHTTTHNMRF